MVIDTSPAPERILVVVAHADDIEFGAAGSIARWVQGGSRVTYCIVTDNGAGSNVPGILRRDLVERREKEQRAAARLLGVTDVRLLGYRDGELEPSLALRRDITRLIREIKPDRVICQDPATVFVESWYVNHPDHRAAGEATIYAVFPSAGTRPIFPELLDEGYEPHDVKELYMMLTLSPDIAVDISDTIDMKLQALLCHESQVGAEVAAMVREWDSDVGRQIGCAYAEDYRVIRFEQPSRGMSDQAEGQGAASQSG